MSKGNNARCNLSLRETRRGASVHKELPANDIGHREDQCARIGFRIDVAGVQVLDVLHTRRVVWDRFGGFVGERNEHEGRCVLLTTDGERIPSPGTLDPDEMDPFWGEGDVSAVDQLNRLATRLRRSMTSGSPPRAEGHVATRGAAQDPGDGLSPGARRLRSLSEG